MRPMREHSLPGGLFAPAWAGGWGATRVCFGLAAGWAHLLRWSQMEFALSNTDVSFATGPLNIFKGPILGAWEAYSLWVVGVVSLLVVVRGGRGTKPALLLWLATYLGVIIGLSLQARVPERMLILGVIVLLFAPVGESRLRNRWRSPASRWMLMILFSSLYASTGWLKLIYEPGWWDGSTLAYALVDRTFGGSPLAVWVSGTPALVVPMAWSTVLFESLFPVLVWIPKLNPFILLAGLGFHLGIEGLMNVGTLTWTCLAFYPAMLHPEAARRLTAWLARPGHE